MQARVADTQENRAVDKAAGIEKKNVRTWQAEDKSFMEYLIPVMKGTGGMTIPINQQNRFRVLFVHDGVFVDMHVSKVDFARQRYKTHRRCFRLRADSREGDANKLGLFQGWLSQIYGQ